MKYKGFDLGGKVALITGAGRGIGRAIAIGMAQAGADVAISARSVDQLNEVAGEIKKAGKDALVLPADLSEIEAVRKLPVDVIEHFGKIGILVNNAGMIITSPAEDVTEEDWDKVMNVNLKASFFLAQTVGRIMMEQKTGGSIICTTSEVQDQAEPDLGAYCPTKGGLKMVVKALATEWGEYGIRVNCLAPCFIKTEINKPLFAGSTDGLKEFYESKLKRVPLGRPGEPEDMVGAAIFLASDSASFVSGTTILCDGAYTAH